MATTEARIPFPILGINRRAAYQDQNPQTTPHAMNVFVGDSQQNKHRGGSRPGFVKLFDESVGEMPVLMKTVVSRSNVDNQFYKAIVVGTQSTFHVGRSVREFEDGVYKFTPQLVSSGSTVLTEQGDGLLFEDGSSMVVSQFELTNVDRGLVAVFQGQLAIAFANTMSITGTAEIASNVLTPDIAFDFLAAGVRSDRHYVEVTDHPSGRTMQITTVTDESLILSGTIADGACTYRIIPAVLLLDVDNLTASPVVPTAGFVPDNPSVMTVFRDRLVWATGREWYMSRQGDPGDYNYGADAADGGRAVAAPVSDAGQPGEPIRAMAPSGFDYLVMFAEDSTWIMRGDPAYGGQLYNLSRLYGCVDTDAWCYGTDGEIYFLSKSGLYVLAPDARTPPQPVSKQPLPNNLQSLDGSNYRVTLAFDVFLNAVFVFASSTTEAVTENWMLDIATGSFWQFGFSDQSYNPITAVTYSVSPADDARVVIASQDGFIRACGGTDDDGLPINSWVLIGPVPVNPDWSIESILNDFYVVLGEADADVMVKVFTGESSEDVTEKARNGVNPDFTVSVASGRSRTFRPRVRASSVCFRLESSSKWAMELLSLVVARAGAKRF